MADLSTEERILSLVSKDSETLDQAIALNLRATEFVNEDCATCFEILVEMREQNLEINYDNVLARLSTTPKAKSVYLKSFGEGPAAQNLDFWVMVLRNSAWKHGLRALAGLIMEKAARYDPARDPRKVAAEINNAVAKALDLPANYETKTVYEVAYQIASDFVDDIKEGRTGYTSGVPSGIAELDRHIGGFVPGSLYLVAARTGQGKTTAACNFALNVARAGKPAAFYTIEMSARQVVEKLLSRESRLSVRQIQRREVGPEQAEIFIKAAASFDGLPLKVMESGRSYGELKQAIKQLCRVERPSLVIVDYIQLLSSQSKDKRNYQLSDMAADIKKLALDEKIPILILAQLGRDVEDPSGKHREAGLRDIKDGAIEQDVDVAMLLYDMDGETPQIHLKKNRFGRTGKIDVFSSLATNFIGDKPAL